MSAERLAARWRAGLLSGLKRAGPVEAVTSNEEASCFYHPASQAAVPCAACGRFLCSVCDLEIDGRHLCPGCLERGGDSGAADRLVTERTLWDRIALSLAVLPMLIFYFTLITAPMAVFIALRYWRSPLGLVTLNRFRFVLALAIAGLQIVGWIVLFGWLAVLFTSELSDGAAG